MHMICNAHGSENAIIAYHDKSDHRLARRDRERLERGDSITATDASAKLNHDAVARGLHVDTSAPARRTDAGAKAVDAVADAHGEYRAERAAAAASAGRLRPADVGDLGARRDRARHADVVLVVADAVAAEATVARV